MLSQKEDPLGWDEKMFQKAVSRAQGNTKHAANRERTEAISLPHVVNVLDEIQGIHDNWDNGNHTLVVLDCSNSPGGPLRVGRGNERNCSKHILEQTQEIR